VAVKNKFNMLFQILFDAIYCILFFLIGIFFTFNYLLHNREWCITDSTIALLLVASVIWRNYWYTKLIALQKKMIATLNVQLESLKEENAKLQDVALASAAVGLTIEHEMLPINSANH
jgi:hypothetical protein